MFLASAALLFAAFLPGSYGLPVWVALVPSMIAARRMTPKALLWWAWVAGYVHCSLAYYWIWEVTVAGWLLLPLYLGLYWPLYFVSSEMLARRFGVPRVASAVVLWPAFEWVRGMALTGLPWFFLGHSLYRWPALIQSADLGGVLLVSAGVVAVNALAAEFVSSGATATRRAVAAGAVVLLVALNLGYGAWRLGMLKLVDGPKVACVQPNVPQSIKEMPTDEYQAGLFARLRAYTLSDEARKAEVVFWPETIMPGLMGIGDLTVAVGMTASEMLDELVLQGTLDVEKRRAVDAAVKGGAGLLDEIRKAAGESVIDRFKTDQLFSATARLSGRTLVAGAIYAMADAQGRITGTLNRVYQIDASGAETAHYDKVHLVPFGEFVPFRESCPPVARLLGRMMPYAPSVLRGPEFKVLTVGKYKYGPAICFEDTFSYIGRRYRKMGADILLNVTNDGWFGGTFELEAHLANAVFRAVETRMAVVRAANTGVSVVISPKGEIAARLVDKVGDDREIEGLLVADVETCAEKPVYVSMGDAWVVGGLVVLGAMVGFGARGRGKAGGLRMANC
jgi:apolipoprotein N-acyltransferase